MSKVEKCRLCLAVDSRGLPTVKEGIENTRLFCTKSFVVVPALGPLIVGHILVVSRLHFPSLAAMELAGIAEYEEVRKSLSKREPFCSSNFLEVEHGATDHLQAGACISHAHVHWLPGLGHLENILEGFLPPLDVTSLADLSLRNVPYLHIRKAHGPSRFYSAERVESQLIRQLVCEQLDRIDWDWSANPHYELIEETISQWRNGADDASEP